MSLRCPSLFLADLSGNATGLLAGKPVGLGLVIAVVVVADAAIFGLVFFIFLQQLTKARAHLQRLADALNFSVIPDRRGFGPVQFLPTIEGRRAGRDVRMFSYLLPFKYVEGKRVTVRTLRPRKKNKARAAVEVGFEGNANFILEIYPLAPALRFLVERALQTVSTDDPGFDRVFLVKSNNPELARRVLTPEICAWLDEHRKGWRRAVQLTIRDGCVRYSERGFFSRAEQGERFAAMIDFLAALAARVGTARLREPVSS
jgi:Protein of unknown function (DUF3137)